MSAAIGLYAYFGAKWLEREQVMRHGYPLLNADGSIDATVLAQHARWPVLTLEADSCIARPDVVAELRRLNPAIKVLAFLNLGMVWWREEHSMSPETDVTRKLYQAAQETNGFLWSARNPRCYYDPWNGPRLRPDGAPQWSSCNANLASERFVAAAIDVLNSSIAIGLGPDYGTPPFDGIFFDYAGWKIPRDPGKDVPDFARAGAPADGLDFNARFVNGYHALMAGVRTAAPDGFQIVVNDGGTTRTSELPYLAGNMRENWPAQGGGTWATNYKGLGYDMRRHLSECWINVLPASYDPVTCAWDAANKWNRQKARFALGTAYLLQSEAGSGPRVSMTTNERPAMDERWAKWFDFYEIDLGAPLGPPVARPLGTYRRDFERGYVIVDPPNANASIVAAP